MKTRLYFSFSSYTTAHSWCFSICSKWFFKTTYCCSGKHTSTKGVVFVFISLLLTETDILCLYIYIYMLCTVYVFICVCVYVCKAIVTHATHSEPTVSAYSLSFFPFWFSLHKCFHDANTLELVSINIGPNSSVSTDCFGFRHRFELQNLSLIFYFSFNFILNVFFPFWFL